MRWNDSSVVVVVELSQSILTTLTKRMQERWNMLLFILCFLHLFFSSVFFFNFTSFVAAESPWICDKKTENIVQISFFKKQFAVRLRELDSF